MKLFCLTLFLTFSLNVHSIVFYSTSDPSYNTQKPFNELAEIWELQGKWGNFTGVPIADQFFITAQHVGLYETFELDGVTYSVQLFVDDNGSDLRIVKIKEIFPKFAQLYETQDEKNKSAVIFGRGKSRGESIVVDNKLKGWFWSNSDAALRYGENKINDIIIAYSGADILKMSFDPQNDKNTMSFSAGDSGGGVFIKQNNQYKLAGINYVVDGPYSLNNLGDPIFVGAIFDETDLYKFDKLGWSKVVVPSTGASYAIRIYSRVNWIKRVIEWYSTDPVPTLQSTFSLDGQYLDEFNILVDPINQIVAIPVPPETTFFRLKSDKILRIISMTVENGLLLFGYKKAL